MLKLVLCILFTLAAVCMAAGPKDPTVLAIAFHLEDAEIRADTLVCNPPGGTHPNATVACNLLKQAKGNLNSIKPLDRYCRPTDYFVNVTIKGTYEGQLIDFKKKYRNGCYALVRLRELVEHFLDYK
ncbi:hypothetical protein BD560DRAFT_380752 [Blakeslea trispora]|nr:hypothetical protein BD560DRAFT_380752 [Blakeslea trispora]